MIIYRDRSADKRGVPKFLEGATDLVIREDMVDQSIKYYGVGPAQFIGEAENWTDIGDNYDARINGSPEPYLIARKIAYMPLTEVEDMHKRGWYVPSVLREGVPLILPVYDDNYLPIFTKEQQRLIDITNAARTVLLSESTIDMSVAARWAAELICASNHIHEKALLRLGLLDNALVLATIAAAAGCEAV